MPFIIPANTLAAGGFDVDNSCRFNDASSDHLLIAPSGAGNLKTWTWSAWVKRGQLGTRQLLFSGYDQAAGLGESIEFTAGDKLEYDLDIAGTDNTVTSAMLFLDPSAWYNIVFVKDLTQGTETDRIKVFVNGVQISLVEAGNGYPAQNATSGLINAAGDYEHHIGALNPGGDFFDGYMSEVVFIDGTANDEEDFGEFDEDSGIWKPIDVSGLTFGTNGFYLEFKQVGTSANASGIGADTSGNTHHFTVANLTAVDQSTDTCTNNFAVMNPLDNFFAGSAFSEGNCKIVTTNGNITYNTSTIGFSSGKWYMEAKLAGSAGYTVGVVRGGATANDNDNKLGNRADGFSYDDGGAVEGNGGDLGGSFATYQADDIIGVYADLDNNELYFSKNGALQNSGTGLALTAGTYFFAVGDNNSSNSSTYEVNFGNPVSALSSAVSDGDYGAFEYSTTITGDSVSKTFKALNTKNLAEYG